MWPSPIPHQSKKENGTNHGESMDPCSNFLESSLLWLPETLYDHTLVLNIAVSTPICHGFGDPVFGNSHLLHSYADLEPTQVEPTHTKKDYQGLLGPTRGYQGPLRDCCGLLGLTRTIRDCYPEPWEDPKPGSTLGLYTLHHRSIGVQNWGFYFLDPLRAL